MIRRTASAVVRAFRESRGDYMPVLVGGLLGIGMAAIAVGVLLGVSLPLGRMGAPRGVAIPLGLIAAAGVWIVMWPPAMRLAMGSGPGFSGGGGLMSIGKHEVGIEDARAAVFALDALLALSFDRESMSQLTPVQHDGVRAGVIQHYLTVYELCYALIDRWVKEHRDEEETRSAWVDQVLLFAASDGLIANVARWTSNGRERRDLTNIVGWDGEYHPIAKRADRAHALAPGLIADARALLVRLDAEAEADDGEGGAGASAS